MSNSEYVTLAVADGTSMSAYVSRPAGDPKAGLIVFQEAFGVNAHICEVAGRFAQEGYLAIAPELFHRTAPGFKCGYTEFPAAMDHIRALTDAGLEADIRAAHAWLPRGLPISAIGYCMGGRTACLAGIILPLACTISYYGGGIGPSTFFTNLLDRLPDLQSPLLLFWGGLDRNIPPESIRPVEDKLREDRKTYTNVVFSYADHGFFCDARTSYNEEAAVQSWALTQAFLSEHLKSKRGAGC
jgi:carboxymethylenebutenolidase